MFQRKNTPDLAAPEKKVTLACAVFILIVGGFLSLQCLTIEYRQTGERVEAAYALKSPPLPVTVFCLLLMAFAAGVPIPAGFVAAVLGYLARVGNALAAPGKDEK